MSASVGYEQQVKAIGATRASPLLVVGVYLLWVAAVLDPIGNFFQLRYIALAYAAACIGGYISVFGMNDSVHSIRVRLILYMLIIMPLYGLLLYSFHASSSEFLDTSYIAAGVLISTSLIYVNRHMCEVGFRALAFSLRLLSLIIVAMFMSQLLGADTSWISLFTERSVALVSFREYAGLSIPYIYFLASPMLIYLVAYDVHMLSKNASVFRGVVCFISLLSLALSGTRAHIVLAVVYVPIYHMLLYKGKAIVSIVLGAGLLSVYLIFLGGAALVGAFFSLSETSNSMKVAMLSNYMEIFDHPLVLIFGQGYNAHEWSEPFREMIAEGMKASKTELTYLELVRVYGLLVATPFFVLLVRLLRATARFPEKYRWIYPAFVLYLIDSAFNPYLFSSNGMLPLALIVSMAFLIDADSKTRFGFRQ